RRADHRLGAGSPILRPLRRGDGAGGGRARAALPELRPHRLPAPHAGGDHAHRARRTHPPRPRSRLPAGAVRHYRRLRRAGRVAIDAANPSLVRLVLPRPLSAAAPPEAKPTPPSPPPSSPPERSDTPSTPFSPSNRAPDALRGEGDVEVGDAERLQRVDDGV